MTERRRFSSRERVAMFLAADGHCENCGAELEPGWHADHRTPYSRGGSTDVVNGDALCPSCNLKKGAKMTDAPRAWQQEALERLRRHDGTDFLTVATPGAGKTRFALSAMAEERSFYIVVVPSTRLRFQWADAASELQGITLDPNFENATGQPASDVDGVVVTYQAVASSPLIYRRLTSSRRTFVVLDEVHHCGDKPELRWGEAVRTAFEHATRRLLLSGTPFRGDNAAIPFVTYDGDPLTSVPDYRYDYGLALRDGVVRSVEFACYDGTARWMDAGHLISVELQESAKADEGRALSSALIPDSEWMRAVLPEAHNTLSRIRRDVPDAGGLIIAASMEHARAIAQRLSRIVGDVVPVAVSDDPKARDTIEQFARSSAPWLVAVNMVSEGVDIPRLMVGVYVTQSRTDTFFRQAVGRFVRTRDDESDSYPATIFIPSIPRLLELARELELERDHVLNDIEVERKQGEQRRQQTFDLVEPLAAIDGHYSESILSGERFTPEEMQRALEVMHQAGISNGISPTQMARALRIGAGKVVGTAVIEVQGSDRPHYREVETAHGDVSRLVRRVAYAVGAEHKDVWKRVNKAVGETTVKGSSLENLNRRLELLSRWLDDENF